MSERPTPRTAKAMMELPGRWNSIWVVPAEIACDLESELGDAIRERAEARELAQELLDALSKLVALNANMTSDDCTYERAYYCYYKGHYDKWKLATEALAKAKEGAK